MEDSKNMKLAELVVRLYFSGKGAKEAILEAIKIKDMEEIKTMNNEVEKYFKEKYSKADFRVVPGHWPDFKTKEDVDHWIMTMELMSEQFNDYLGDDEDE